MLLLLIGSALTNVICLYYVLSRNDDRLFTSHSNRINILNESLNNVKTEIQFMHTKLETCFELSQSAIRTPKEFSVKIKRVKYKPKVKAPKLPERKTQATGIWT